MRLDKIKPGDTVVVIGDDHYNTLGVVRSLGEAGFVVALVLMSDHATCVTRSKWVSELRFAPNDTSVYEALTEICAAFHRPVAVVPTSDRAAIVVGGFLEDLPGNCVAPGIAGGLLPLEDKATAKALARSCGLNTAAGLVVESVAGGLEVSKQLHFPVIIKPVVSVEGKKSDISIAYTSEEVSLCLKKFFSGGYERVLVEEYICGQDSHMVEVMGYRSRNGVSSVAGVIEKIREYPLANGSTSYARFVSSHEGIDLEAVRSFVDKAGFFGIYDMEFKFSAGKAYFIECNFRVGAPSYAMTQLGCNVPALWVSGAILSHPVSDNRPFMVEQRDVFHVIKGDMRPAEWIKQFRGSRHIFAVKGDMRPVRAYWSNLVLSRIARRLPVGKS